MHLLVTRGFSNWNWQDQIQHHWESDGSPETLSFGDFRGLPICGEQRTLLLGIAGENGNTEHSISRLLSPRAPFCVYVFNCILGLIALRLGLGDDWILIGSFHNVVWFWFGSESTTICTEYPISLWSPKSWHSMDAFWLGGVPYHSL